MLGVDAELFVILIVMIAMVVEFGAAGNREAQFGLAELLLLLLFY